MSAYDFLSEWFSDDRIKAACAIYCVGWNTYPDETGVPDPKAGDAGVVVWRRSMEPESYARLVRCPMLFLDATNDQHGKMDWSFRTLDRVPTEVRWEFTPRYRRHIAADQGADLPLWMDAHLKGGQPFPQSPVAEVRLGSTQPLGQGGECPVGRRLAPSALHWMRVACNPASRGGF